MSSTVLLNLVKAEQEEKLRWAAAERLVREAQQGKRRPSVLRSLLLALGRG